MNSPMNPRGSSAHLYTRREGAAPKEMTSARLSSCTPKSL